MKRALILVLFASCTTTIPSKPSETSPSEPLVVMEIPEPFVPAQSYCGYNSHSYDDEWSTNPTPATDVVTADVVSACDTGLSNHVKKHGAHLIVDAFAMDQKDWACIKNIKPQTMSVCRLDPVTFTPSFDGMENLEYLELEGGRQPDLRSLESLKTIIVKRGVMTPAFSLSLSPDAPIETIRMRYGRLSNDEIEKLVETYDLKDVSLADTFIGDAEDLKEMSAEMNGYDVATGMENSSHFVGQKTFPDWQGEGHHRAVMHDVWAKMDGFEEIRKASADGGVKSLAKLKNLRVLDLSGTKISPDAMKTIGTISTLESLDIGGTRVSDLSPIKHLKLRTLKLKGIRPMRRLKDVAEIQTLEHLSVPYLSIDHDTVRHIARLSRLKTLNLRSSGGSLVDLNPLSSLVFLEDLNLNGVQLNKDNAKFLRRLRRLKKLDLGSTYAPDQVIELISDRDGLRELDISNTHTTETGLRLLAGLKQLEVLDLSRTKIERGLSSISDLPKLRELSLYMLPLRPDEYAHLAAMKKLEKLVLYYGQARNEALKDLPTTLRSLVVSTMRIEDEGIAHLSRLENLVHLDIASAHFTDTSMSEIGKLTKLRHLNVGDSKLTDFGFKKLEGLKNLRTLTIGGTLVTEGGLTSVSGFPLLEEMLVYDTPIPLGRANKVRMGWKN